MTKVAAVTLLTLMLHVSGVAQSIRSRAGFALPPPPAAEAKPVIDNYDGTKITDDYRWLENGKSPETRTFIDEQNAYTTRYLKMAPIRNQILDDLDPLEHTSRWSIPIQRAGNYYFMKRLAGEEQASIYMRRGWTGAPSKNPPGAPKDERLIDPAAFSRDPNTSVRLADVSHDGLLVAYEVRQGGADESTVRIYSLTNKKPLEDELPATGVYYSVFFTPDGKGLYYARTDSKGTLLYLHAIGTRISDDKLIFGREFHGELLGPIDVFRASITDDNRYLVMARFRAFAICPEPAGARCPQLFRRRHSGRLRAIRGIGSRRSKLVARRDWLRFEYRRSCRLAGAVARRRVARPG